METPGRLRRASGRTPAALQQLLCAALVVALCGPASGRFVPRRAQAQSDGVQQVQEAASLLQAAALSGADGASGSPRQVGGARTSASKQAVGPTASAGPRRTWELWRVVVNSPCFSARGVAVAVPFSLQALERADDGAQPGEQTGW